MEKKSEEWLRTAVGGIRFQYDRDAVEEELRGHLEDKREQLLLHCPGLDGAQAETLALERMGDPEEIGKALAKIHRPWLGRLWLASRWALGLLVLWLVLAGGISYDHDMSNGGTPVWGEFRSGDYVRPLELRPERAELGGYSFQIVEAVYADYPESSGRKDLIQVTFRVSSPRFWARVDGTAVRNALTAVAQDGTRFVEEGGRLWEAEESRNRQALSMGLSRWGPFSRDYTVYMRTPWQEGDRVELNFDFGKGSFALSAQVARQEAEP